MAFVAPAPSLPSTSAAARHACATAKCMCRLPAATETARVAVSTARTFFGCSSSAGLARCRRQFDCSKAFSFVPCSSPQPIASELNLDIVEDDDDLRPQRRAADIDTSQFGQQDIGGRAMQLFAMPFAWVLVDKLAISVSKAATPGKVDWDSVLRVAPLERMADLPLAFVQTVLMNSADFGKGVVGALPLMGLVLALAKSGENGPLAGFVRACRSRWAMFAPDRMDVLGYLYCAALGLVFGVGEEILYRGFLQNSFSQDLSWVGGVGGTAIVVAALEYMGTLPGALLSMGISAYLSVLYDTQGQSLAVSIGAHTAFNAAVFAWISSVLVKQFAIEEVEAVERREQARAARRQRRERASRSMSRDTDANN